jgi:hypothetical protein
MRHGSLKKEIYDLSRIECWLLASASKVSTKFARKVMAKANAGVLIDHAEEKERKKKTTNPGAKTITGLDEVVLLQLRNEKPWRGLEDYRRRLFQITGTVASTPVISNCSQ